MPNPKRSFINPLLQASTAPEALPSTDMASEPSMEPATATAPQTIMEPATETATMPQTATATQPATDTAPLTTTETALLPATEPSTLLATQPSTFTSTQYKEEPIYQPRKRGKQAFEKIHERGTYWIHKDLKRRFEKLARAQEMAQATLINEAIADLLRKYEDKS